MIRLFELLTGVYWDARHWIWDRSEQRFVREAYRRLGHDNCVYLHETEGALPSAALVRLSPTPEDYNGDENESLIVWEPHGHMEGR